MSRFSHRATLAALAAGTVATVATLLAPAVASADPTGLAEPLLTSDCSFAQVDAALHATAPQLASMLDSNPQQKADLQRKFDQPVEQRRAELQRAIDANPQAAQNAQDDPQSTGLRETLATVAATCHNY